MNLFRLPGIFIVLLFITFGAGAQVFYQHDTTVKVFAYGHEQNIAWGGGFNNPEISVVDLNNDGINDMVVYERGLGVSTYINYASAGSAPNYRYAPEYAVNFPPIYVYLLMADYNCDGVPDLFHRGGSGFSVYTGYYNVGHQLCFNYYKELMFYNGGYPAGAPAFVNNGDIPAIVDVDGDGDLDFISYYSAGENIRLYKNMRVEQGLPCDSIKIELKDRCWGRIYQGFERAHQLEYYCDNSGLRPAGSGSKVTHSGNSPCLFDWDLDGDMDYLDGSTSFNEMTFLKNGRVEAGGGPDSMVWQDTLWQTGGKMVSLPVWPTAYNVDVDQDGRKDLLITPNSGTGSENYKCIWYYKNLSAPGAPNWQFQSDSFLTDRTIDMGSAAFPMLFDYDKDGKPDLIVGSDGYRQTSGLLAGRLSLYKNTTAAGNASFTLQSTDLAGIGAQAFSGVHPAVGDMDNDGITDLVLGHTNGTLSYYKNVAASDAVQPDWQLTTLQLTDMTGNVINVDGGAAPFLYDVDHDGKKDLLIGGIYGYIQYYRNMGTAPGTVKLKLINTRLGLAKSDPRQAVGGYSAPFIGKIDASGTEYLLMGSNSGNIYQYTGFQSGDAAATYSLLDSQYSYIDTAFNLYNHPGAYCAAYDGRRSTVAVGDIDGSGSYSMIVGNVKGGLEFYKRKVYVVANPAAPDAPRVLVYPNPASDVLSISWEGLAANDGVSISICNMAGQRLFATQQPAAPSSTTVALASLPPGVYVCIVQSGAMKYYSRFTVIR